MRKSFKLLFLLFLSTGFASAARWNPKLGNPIYVLEQPQNAHGQSTFRLIELQPAEKKISRFQGYHLVLRGEGLKPKSFGFVGYELANKQIKLGTLLLLDGAGQIWKSRITEDSHHSVTRDWQRVPGNYSLLEQDADHKLFAVTKSQDVVEIGDDGVPSEPVFSRDLLLSGEKIISLRADQEGKPVLLTSGQRLFHGGRFEVLSLGLSPQAQAYPAQDAYWITDPAHKKIFQVDGKTLQIIPLALDEHIQQRQDGAKLEALGADADSFYFRLGGHAFRVAPIKSMSHPSLSLDAIASDFFADRAREFSVNYTLFTTLSVMQPRSAERCNGLLY